ncbi:MAG: ABC transporter permease, partial [Clostridia bacterium]|nr:ABC transporter permease [Clostridia bacterium]
GAVIGAIEGYYGGIVDMTAERVKDIISGIPFIVVTVLFQMHMAQKVGVIGALIYAFILTGWVGNSSLVRTQFYRFKHQEYVMAARTLGANDFRLITKHIFPNSLGTIITSCAFDIPGVILSETSLSYLGIINLASSSMSSIGTMLSTGQAYLKDYPHVVLFPAIFIGLLMLSFNLFSNGLRDTLNPQLRGSEG